MRTRTKTLGVAAALAAIAVSIPTAVQASADPDPATPTSSVPVPVAPIPDPQGPGCDAYKNQVPTGPGSFASMATEIGSQALASNPDLSTFSAAISGNLNPAVYIVSVLDGGPYVVFAPTNEAFAKLDPAELDALKADPAKLTSVLYYHMVLGYLGPDDVHGKMPTQQGALINVTGKGGDIKINDTAKVVCGGITSKGAKIFMIDTVLNPADAPLPNGASTTATTSSSSAETTTPATTSSASSAEATPTTSAAPTTTKAPNS